MTRLTRRSVTGSAGCHVTAVRIYARTEPVTRHRHRFMIIIMAGPAASRSGSAPSDFILAAGPAGCGRGSPRRFCSQYDSASVPQRQPVFFASDRPGMIGRRLREPVSRSTVTVTQVRRDPSLKLAASSPVRSRWPGRRDSSSSLGAGPLRRASTQPVTPASESQLDMKQVC